MATIKKKDLKKYKSKKELDELVDAEGAPIEGSRNQVNNTEIEVSPQQTSDDFVTLALQRKNFNFIGGPHPYSGTDRTTSRLPEGEDVNEKDEIDEAEDLMRKMVEDIVRNKLNDAGMVKKSVNQDVNRNDIPDMEELGNEKPTPVSYANDFISNINTVPLHGDEKAIILNYILSNFDTSDISNDYKNILRKKI